MIQKNNLFMTLNKIHSIMETKLFANTSLFRISHKESKHVTNECINTVLNAYKSMMDAYQLPQLTEKNCLPSIHRPITQHSLTHDWTSA